MNNPNHPLYNALGGGSNLHLLDNVLFATDQNKQNIHQYSYPIETLSHQHAMNLAVSGHSVAPSTIDSTALIYQQNDHQQQQQQPISYKLPQVGTSLILQQNHKIQQYDHHQQHSQLQIISNLNAINSLQDKKKDIVAQAMREEKIFEELNQRSDSQPSTHHTILAKKATQMGLISIPNSPATTHSHRLHVEPISLTSDPLSSYVHSTPKQLVSLKNNVDHMQSSSVILSDGNVGEQHIKSANFSRQKLNVTRQFPQRQQIIPRLQLFEDEDDGLTCRMCLQPFWYKSQLFEHLKSTHSVLDPERYEREEREKKVRRQREEQQRVAIAKQQRLVASTAALRGILPNLSSGGKGVTVGVTRGVSNNRRMGGGIGSRGGRGGYSSNKLQVAGPRPSFQYRDGSFICDLCKKSFIDGNDMVSHWKQHVKQQQVTGTPGRGRGSRGRGSSSLRGRPPLSGKQPGKVGRPPKRKNRKDKGKPKWTAYLLWSTRKRKELAAEQADLNFAQISKAISEGWREVTPEENEALRLEAEELNSKPREDVDSGEEDFSDMEFEDEDDDIDQIFDEFEQEQLEESRSIERKGKRGRKPGQKYPRPNFSDDEDSLDMETTRSGRVSKKKKYLHHLNEGEDESESDEDFSTESDLENEEGPKNTKKNSTLPLKKRGQASKMIDADMKRAIKAALDARPRVVPIGSLSSISDQAKSENRLGTSPNNKVNDRSNEELFQSSEVTVAQENLIEEEGSETKDNSSQVLDSTADGADFKTSESLKSNEPTSGGNPCNDTEYSNPNLGTDDLIQFTPLAGEIDDEREEYKNPADETVL